MILYDIHTHTVPDSHVSDQYHLHYILNSYPENYSEDCQILTKGGTLSCGVLPWISEDYEYTLNLLEQIAGNKDILAIGEIGLDKLHQPGLKIQTEIFIKQIELAIKYNKPVIIHCVKAWDELISIHKYYNCPDNWIIHGFRGNERLIKQLEKLGFNFSFGEKYNSEALKNVSLNSIFCETDTSLKKIHEIYLQIATDLNISLETLAEQIADNISSIIVR